MGVQLLLLLLNEHVSMLSKWHCLRVTVHLLAIDIALDLILAIDWRVLVH